MKSLLWKDCRLNALVLALGVATWLGPYLVGVLWLCFGNVPWRVAARLRWAFMLEPALTISLEATILPLLLLGANAIARERSDRSAEFLAYLPPSRARIIASKAAVALAFMALVWATNLLVAFALLPALTSSDAMNFEMTRTLCGAVVATSVLVFGTAWLGSSTVDTPLTAVGFSMAITLLVAVGIQASNYYLGWPADGSGNAIGLYWTASTMAIVGLSCFVAGTWLYLRRVEP